MSVAQAAPPQQAPPDADEVVWRETHSRASRWMHWINFPLLAVMVFSGLRIYWADDSNAVGIGSIEIFHFFPDWVYERLDLDQALARGIAFHFTFGWLFVANGVAYVAWLAVSGEWRHIVPDQRALREVRDVVLHDLGLRDEAPVQGRYNAAQQVTYTLVIAMGALIVATGFAILKSTQLQWLTALFGGYETARLIHFSATIGFLLFFVLHLVQVARAGAGNLRAMVTGFERDPRRRPEATPAGQATPDQEADA